MKLFACDITSRCEVITQRVRNDRNYCRKSYSSKFDGARKRFRERFAARRTRRQRTDEDVLSVKRSIRGQGEAHLAGSSSRGNRIKLLTERFVQPCNSHKFRQTIARYEVVARVNWMWDCIRSYYIHSTFWVFGKKVYSYICCNYERTYIIFIYFYNIYYKI